MSKTLVTACTLLAVAAGLMAAPQSRSGGPDSPEVLLKTVATRTLVHGDLESAIRQYRAIATHHRASHPAVAAQALLYLARSYERLGRSEARSIYEEIVRDHAASREGAEASARLATLTGSPAQFSLNPRHWSTGVDVPYTFSPDGRAALIITTDLANTRLILKDLATSETRVLVTRTEYAYATGNPRMSPDGKLVAYTWLQRDPPENRRTLGLRLVGVEPGARPRIVLPQQPVTSVNIIGWSIDGRSILVAFRKLDQSDSATPPFTLGWVSVVDGAVRTIKSFEPWQLGRSGGIGQIRLSPDGSTIGYTAHPAGGSSDRYIFTIDVNGGNETAVVRMAGANVGPIWTPDGASIIFLNGPEVGRWGLWSLPVRNGQARGEPTLVQANFPGFVIDMTRAGDLFYTVPVPGGFSQLIAERLPGPARVRQIFNGQNGSWSNTNRVAFTRIPRGSEERYLVVRSLDAGAERTYRHPGITTLTPRWLPDGDSLIVLIEEDGPITATNGSGAFYRVDLNTGAFTRLFAQGGDGYVRSLPSVLSPDGRTMYLVTRKSVRDPWTGIDAIDLESGLIKSAIAIPGSGLSSESVPAVAVSPDGSMLAIHTWAEGSTTHSRILTMGIDGTGLQQLHGPFDGWSGADRIRYTPDGRFIVFIADSLRAGDGRPTTDSGIAPGWRMMRIPAAGGAVEADGLDSLKLVSDVPLPALNQGNLIGSFDFSPDGSRVIFTARTVPMSELWTLDNVWSVIRAR